ncbi:uncharacterized protein LOC135926014 isoform X2 [Gordionus sp. m RMFG-2023]|uniref:uncharacterized protein LOC135926014 isoform X2 n=1 Tax=Gordionus sp. m RMFG-2023 TaxID=3053472 RepID=UPI0031FC819D
MKLFVLCFGFVLFNSNRHVNAICECRNLPIKCSTPEPTNCTYGGTIDDECGCCRVCAKGDGVHCGFVLEEFHCQDLQSLFVNVIYFRLSVPRLSPPIASRAQLRTVADVAKFARKEKEHHVEEFLKISNALIIFLHVFS